MSTSVGKIANDIHDLLKLVKKPIKLTKDDFCLLAGENNNVSEFKYQILNQLITLNIQVGNPVFDPVIISIKDSDVMSLEEALNLQKTINQIQPSSDPTQKVINIMKTLKISFEDLAIKLDVSPEKAKDMVYKLSPKASVEEIYSIIKVLDLKEYLGLK